MSDIDEDEYIPKFHDLPEFPGVSWVDFEPSRGGIKEDELEPKSKKPKTEDIADGDRQEAVSRSETENVRKKRFDYLRRGRKNFNELLLKKIYSLLNRQTGSVSNKDWYRTWTMKFTDASQTSFNEAIDEIFRLIEIEHRYQKISKNIQNARTAEVKGLEQHTETSPEELQAKIEELESRNDLLEQKLQYQQNESQFNKESRAKVTELNKELAQYKETLAQRKNTIHEQKSTIEEQRRENILKQAAIEEYQLQIHNLNQYIKQSGTASSQKKSLASSLSSRVQKLSFHDIF